MHLLILHVVCNFELTELRLTSAAPIASESSISVAIWKFDTGWHKDSLRSTIVEYVSHNPLSKRTCNPQAEFIEYVIIGDMVMKENKTPWRQRNLLDSCKL